MKLSQKLNSINKFFKFNIFKFLKKNLQNFKLNYFLGLKNIKYKLNK